MRKLIEKAVLLILLIGCLVVITSSPQRSHADPWGECDAAREARDKTCNDQYKLCLMLNQGDCDNKYNTCLVNSLKEHHDYSVYPPTGCIFDGSDPQPWPVVNTSRSDCLSTCSLGASRIEDVMERFDYYDNCWNFCDATYPKP